MKVVFCFFLYLFFSWVFWFIVLRFKFLLFDFEALWVSKHLKLTLVFLNHFRFGLFTNYLLFSCWERTIFFEWIFHVFLVLSSLKSLKVVGSGICKESRLQKRHIIGIRLINWRMRKVEVVSVWVELVDETGIQTGCWSKSLKWHQSVWVIGNGKHLFRKYSI